MPVLFAKKPKKDYKNIKTISPPAILYLIVSNIIVITLTLIGQFFYTTITSKDQSVDIYNTHSENLAIIPSGSFGDIQAQIQISPENSIPVKSFFKYSTTIKNNTNKGIDDFIVSIAPKDELSISPKILVETEPEGLKNLIDIEKLDTKNKTIKYRVSLLNPNQYIKLNYYAYSNKTVSSGSINTDIVKKDWKYEVFDNDDGGKIFFGDIIALPDKKLLDATVLDAFQVIFISMMGTAIFVVLMIGYMYLINTFFRTKLSFRTRKTNLRTIDSEKTTTQRDDPNQDIFS
jgi:hypothetical protein